MLFLSLAGRLELLTKLLLAGIELGSGVGGDIPDRGDTVTGGRGAEGPEKRGGAAEADNTRCEHDGQDDQDAAKATSIT